METVEQNFHVVLFASEHHKMFFILSFKLSSLGQERILTKRGSVMRHITKEPSVVEWTVLVCSISPAVRLEPGR